MHEILYRARLEPDPDGGFLVTFPDVPEAITHGATRTEALEQASDALEVALLGRMVDGASLPAPRARGRGLAPVAPSAQAAAKLALYAAWRQSGLSKSALAARLGKAENEVRRMLDPYHKTKLPAIEVALAALGRRLVVSVEAA